MAEVHWVRIGSSGLFLEVMATFNMDESIVVELSACYWRPTAINCLLLLYFRGQHRTATAPEFDAESDDIAIRALKSLVAMSKECAAPNSCMMLIMLFLMDAAAVKKQKTKKNSLAGSTLEPLTTKVR